MITVVEACVQNLDLAMEVECLFDDRWTRCFITDEYEMKGATDIEVGPWLQELGGESPDAARTRTREVAAMVPIPPAPMTPRAARLTATYRIHAEEEADKHLPTVSVKCQYQIHDIPFSEYFTVQESILLRPMGDDVWMSKAYSIDWHYTTWLGSMIESSTLQSEKASGDHLLRVLRRRASKSRRTCRAEVWEVQRRDSIFASWENMVSLADVSASPSKSSSDSPLRRRRSSASFMPERRRSSFLSLVFRQRWRWVDANYCKHPWLRGTPEIVNDSDVPPIAHPNGWVLQEPGFEVELTNLCDSEGWQYASELSTLNSDNPDSSWFCYCRRRLWTGTFFEPDVKEAAADQGHEPRLSNDDVGCVPCQHVFLQVRRSLRKHFPQLALSRFLLGTGFVWD